MEDWLFWACAGAGVPSALLVVTRRNPLYSAFFLILTLLALAALMAGLRAPFLAAMHVLVYTGAIMVLFVFVIMLLSLRPEELGGEYPAPYRVFCAIVCAGLLAGLGYLLWTGEPEAAESLPEGLGSTTDVADRVFRQYVLPFELVSVLILVAVFGAIVLARRRPGAGS